MRKILFFGLFFVSSLTWGQFISGSFQVANPLHDFRDNNDNTGFGFQFQGVFMPPDVPLGVGINLGYITFGSESSNRPWSTTIPDVTVNVDRSYNLANFHLLLNLMPRIGSIRPYLEALLGGSYLYTETSVKREGWGSDDDDDEIASTVNHDDFAWSYGAGAGLIICIISDMEENGSEIFLDLKVRYLYGTNASYLTPGGVDIGSAGNVIYDFKESDTDMMTFHVGAAISF